LSDVAYQWRSEDPQDGGPGRVVRWLIVSLLVHAVVLGLWDGARRWAEANPDRTPDWLRSAVLPKPMEPDPALSRLRSAEEQDVEIPLTFLEVDPDRATDEVPPDTRYMSTVNTLAANPNPPKADATQPRVDGTQEDSARILEVVKAVAVPSPPVVEPVAERPEARVTERAQRAQEGREARPKVESVAEAAMPAGETQLAKVTTRPTVPQAQVVRPPQPVRAPQEEQVPQVAQEETLPQRKPIKRLAEARQQKGILVGEQMKQDGGVRRLHIESSLDVKASPFANYDQQFIYAVQQRWYALLDEHRYSLDRTGKVKLRFELRSDGTVAEMNQLESEVGDIWSLLCESAILSQAPYARWPETMRRLIGKDTREITFTFHYR
jgi:hypothetical protein